MKICKYEECERQSKSRDLCHSHYVQVLRGKTLTKLRKQDSTDMPVKKRIKTNITKDPKTKCWNWTLSTQDGYGVISIKGRMYKAHRVSYATFVGEVPDHQPVHHRCHNPSCVNPKHLQLITNIENTAEMMERNSYVKRIAELEAKLADCEENCDKLD
jgi:hypothetical protein